MKQHAFAITSALMIVVSFVSIGSNAAEKPQPVLSKKTMTRFIDDFPSLHSDLKELSSTSVQAFEALIQEGAALQNIDAVREDLDAAQKDPGVKKLVAEHGWGKSITPVYIAIFTAHSIIVAEELIQASADPGVTAYIARWKPTVHPDDLAIVRENRTRLEEMLLGIGQE